MNKKIKLLIILIIIFTTKQIISPQKITISAIGDIMMHYDLQQYALIQENNYLSLFEPTNKIFLNDDLTIANLETVICDELPINGYPIFNTKSLLLDAIKKSGIEVLSIANNHTLDYGTKVIKTTIDEIKKRKILFAGAGYNKDEAYKPIIFSVKGIVIGLFCATWASNNKQNINNDKKKPFLNIIPFDDKNILDNFSKEIKKIKAKVDLLIISYHAGNEYNAIPLDEKEIILKLFADSGADIILSHHPHVLQKIEYYVANNNRKTLIAYSLGNFISGQARFIPVINKKKEWIYQSILTRTAEGIILQFDVTKWKNKISVVNVRIIPIFNVCFIHYKEGKKYIGYKTLFIDTILKNKQKKFLGYNDFENSVKKVVTYRFKKIKELINIPIITPD
jgi:hypothetical protein